MAALFALHYHGLTVAEAIAKWAPPGENDTASYVQRVCWWAHLEPSQVVDSLIQIGSPSVA